MSFQKSGVFLIPIQYRYLYTWFIIYSIFVIEFMNSNQNETSFENTPTRKQDCYSYECECQNKKTRRITFDGAKIGNYSVEYCQKCYDSDDKEFMICEEELI